MASIAVNDSENRVNPDKVPREDRITILVADHEERLERVHSAVTGGRATVEAGPIHRDALFVFGRGAGRSCARYTTSARISITGGTRRWIERAIISNVVIHTHRFRGAPADY